MRLISILFRYKGWPSEAEVVKKLRDQGNLDCQKFKHYRRSVLLANSFLIALLIATIAFFSTVEASPSSQFWSIASVLTIVFCIAYLHLQRSAIFYIYNCGEVLKVKISPLFGGTLNIYKQYTYKFILDGDICEGRITIPNLGDFVDGGYIYMRYIPEKPLLHAPVLARFSDLMVMKVVG